MRWRWGSPLVAHGPDGVARREDARGLDAADKAAVRHCLSFARSTLSCGLRAAAPRGLAQRPILRRKIDLAHRALLQAPLQLERLERVLRLVLCVIWVNQPHVPYHDRVLAVPLVAVEVPSTGPEVQVRDTSRLHLFRFKFRHVRNTQTAQQVLLSLLQNTRCYGIPLLCYLITGILKPIQYRLTVISGRTMSRIIVERVLNKKIPRMIVLPSHLHHLISQTINVVPQISKELASQQKKFLGLNRGICLLINFNTENYFWTDHRSVLIRS